MPEMVNISVPEGTAAMGTNPVNAINYSNTAVLGMVDLAQKSCFAIERMFLNT
jgi:hypothetical protein